MADKKFVAVGEVSKPHGVRGEVCILSYADSPLLFKTIPAVRLTPRTTRAEQAGRTKRAPRVYGLVSSRPHKDRVLLTLEGVTDRDKADALRGLLVEVDANALPPPDPGEIFLHELLGCRVREVDAPDAAPDVGRIREIRDTAGQELWVIRDETGREALLPGVPEFVADIDLDAGLVTITPPPGLLDLFAPAVSPDAPDNASPDD